MIALKVRAVIEQDGALLLSEFDDENGLHFNLPGGTVEQGEALHDALRREVREETGRLVEVGRLLYVWEYVPERFAHKYGDQHSLTLCFACTILGETAPTYDPHQTGARWISLTDLPNTLLYPTELIPYLTGKSSEDVFLP